MSKACLSCSGDELADKLLSAPLLHKSASSERARRTSDLRAGSLLYCLDTVTKAKPPTRTYNKLRGTREQPVAVLVKNSIAPVARDARREGLYVLPNRSELLQVPNEVELEPDYELNPN